MEAQMLEEIERRKQEQIEEAKRREVRFFLTCLSISYATSYKSPPAMAKLIEFSLNSNSYCNASLAILYLLSQNLHLY